MPSPTTINNNHGLRPFIFRKENYILILIVPLYSSEYNFRPRKRSSAFCPSPKPPLSELCEHADQALLSNIVKNHNHVHDVLRHLLPPLKITGHDLRKPTRDRTLSSKEDNGLYRKHFIHRLSTNNYFYSEL